MYHINAKTGNPNLCKSKTCSLEHFKTKEEASNFGSPKETVGAKVDTAVNAVKEELAKDKAVAEAKEDGVIEVPAPTGHRVNTEVTAAIAEEVAEELSTPEKPVRVVEEVSVKRVRVAPVKGKTATRAKNKARSKKQQIKSLVHEVIYHLEELGKVAPKHPLVKRTRKLARKLKR